MTPESTITSMSLGRARDLAPATVHDLLILLASSDDPRLPSSRHVLDEIDVVRFGRGPREVRRHVDGGQRVLALQVPDRRMSSSHGCLRRGPTGWQLDDPQSKNGVVVNGTLTRRTAIGDGSLIELGHTFFLFHSAPLEDGAPPDVDETALRAPVRTLATFDGALAERFAALARIATTSVGVLLLGETGTGKEVVARALHELSGRRGAFVGINCGALPPTLLESELFGHKKGAFTGAAADRPGLVRSAEGGTLFLDEIGELPLASQAAFLRVLQERTVTPVGDDRPVPVDVRLCAATLRDLEALVDAGAFRSDLYGRLIGFKLRLPALRDRRADFGLLLRARLAQIPGGDRMTFAPSALRALFRHDWPLNIRELDSVLLRAVALSPDGVIDLPHLELQASIPPPPRAPRTGPTAPLTPVAATPPLATPTVPPPPPPPAPPPPDAALSPEDAELRGRLVDLLTEHRGNVVIVARALGRRRMQIYRWAQRFGLDLESFRR